MIMHNGVICTDIQVAFLYRFGGVGVCGWWSKTS